MSSIVIQVWNNLWWLIKLDFYFQFTVAGILSFASERAQPVINEDKSTQILLSKSHMSTTTLRGKCQRKVNVMAHSSCQTRMDTSNTIIGISFPRTGWGRLSQPVCSSSLAWDPSCQCVWIGKSQRSLRKVCLSLYLLSNRQRKNTWYLQKNSKSNLVFLHDERRDW